MEVIHKCKHRWYPWDMNGRNKPRGNHWDIRIIHPPSSLYSISLSRIHAETRENWIVFNRNAFFRRKENVYIKNFISIQCSVFAFSARNKFKTFLWDGDSGMHAKTSQHLIMERSNKDFCIHKHLYRDVKYSSWGRGESLLSSVGLSSLGKHLD